MPAPANVHEMRLDGVLVTDDPALFDLDRAFGWISIESYWGKGIPLDVFQKSIANSLVAGAYLDDGRMAAMARVVTDRATFGWVCDVFVDAEARGRGLGKVLVTYLKSHPELQGLRRLHLATRDAHGLYTQFGFGPLTGVDRWMEIRDLEVYRRAPSAD